MDNDQRFEEVFDRHSAAIQAYCLRRTPAADAQDAAAEVFVVAWRRRSELPDDEQVLAWLYGVAYGVVRNQRRATKRRHNLRRRLSGLARAPNPGPEEVTLQHTAYHSVHTALKALSSADREVVTLVAWEGLTRDQVAQVLGCSAEAAKKRYQRAVRKLERVFAGPMAASTVNSRAIVEGGES